MSTNASSAPHLSRISLRVRDPERSARFYRLVLGLESLTSGDADWASDVRAMPSPRRDFRIVFTEGLPPGDHLTGLDRVSFEVPSRESVDRIYHEATKVRARATQPRLYEGHWQTFIFDPDGYKVEVFTRAEIGVNPSTAGPHEPSAA